MFASIPGGHADSRDWRIRLLAFDRLNELSDTHGDLLPYRDLSIGFTFEGERVPLLGPQGIFKPRVLPELPLSITTAPPRPGKPPPYEDALEEGGTISYKYRGTDPHHRDNVGLRKAGMRHVPLVYFFGVAKGIYVAAWPVFVIRDQPDRLTFTVQVDESSVLQRRKDAVFEPESSGRRAYITVAAKKRLHQAAFRERVLAAYRRSCAVCRLRHQELLDAAHILPDASAAGLPVVQNGLALCKLHHAAFDQHFLGVRPDLKIEVAGRILKEKDGPMLVHGLQGFHLKDLHLPRSAGARPGREFVEARYEMFRVAG